MRNKDCKKALALRTFDRQKGVSRGQEQSSFYAHSLQGRDKRHWQPLAEHLRAVAKAAGARGEKFGATNAASLAGLLHDLGKYAPAFQRRLDGAGDKVDHSTAGAQEVVRSATSPTIE